jgi:CelD/BcsL family acetyltransferase involved in cellulose biosynthesis
MYSVRTMLGLRRGIIEFIGTPDSDYNDFIITERDKQCVKLAIEHLEKLRENWERIELVDISENATSLASLSNIATTLRTINFCPYIDLNEPYDTFLSKLSGQFRKNLRRCARLLEKEFKVEYMECSSAHSLNQNMNSFFNLHQARWTSKGSAGVFAESKLRDFHLNIARAFLKKGWLSLSFLKLSGRLVAAHYGFKYRSKLFSYLSGFDPSYSKYGVGTLLLFHVIHNCFKQGLAEFDFTRGAEEYKQKWNPNMRRNRVAVIHRSCRLGMLRDWLYDGYWLRASQLKHVIKNPSWALRAYIRWNKLNLLADQQAKIRSACLLQENRAELDK